MPGLGSMWNFLWRYLITSYPLMGWLFFRCLRIIMSMKFWIILRLRVYAVFDSKLSPKSKVIYVQYILCVCDVTITHNMEVYPWQI